MINSHYRWPVLTLGVLAQAALASFHQGLPSIGPALQESFGVGLIQTGAFFSAVTVGITLTLASWGLLADRIGERGVLAGGLVGAAVALAGAALVRDYAPPFVALVAAGMLGGCANAASGRAVMGWFATGERGLALGVRTYYAAASRPPSARRQEDECLKPEVSRVHAQNLEVYGVRKIWRQMHREGFTTGRDRIARLMRELHLAGAQPGKKKWRTTLPDMTTPRPADLVNRQFTASAPNRLWVADLTYVSTWQAVCYAAFIVDVFSRYIWASASLSVCAPIWSWTPLSRRSGCAALTA